MAIEFGDYLSIQLRKDHVDLSSAVREQYVRDLTLFIDRAMIKLESDPLSPDQWIHTLRLTSGPSILNLKLDEQTLATLREALASGDQDER